MSWLTEHKQTIGRVFALALLLAALSGPFNFSSDGVPPPEWCAAPNLLLEKDLCVRLVSGFEMLAIVTWAFPYLAAGEATLPERARSYLFVLLLTLPALPCLTTLLLVWKDTSRRLRILNRLAWGLALGACLLPIFIQPPLLSTHFWGLWLYAGTAAGALGLEMLAWAVKSHSHSP